MPASVARSATLESASTMESDSAGAAPSMRETMYPAKQDADLSGGPGALMKRVNSRVRQRQGRAQHAASHGYSMC